MSSIGSTTPPEHALTCGAATATFLCVLEEAWALLTASEWANAERLADFAAPLATLRREVDAQLALGFSKRLEDALQISHAVHAIGTNFRADLLHGLRTCKVSGMSFVDLLHCTTHCCGMLQAIPGNGIIHMLNEGIYPGWSETDASTGGVASL